MAFRKGESGNPSTQFRKGESGNPSGRPKGFAEAIKAECGDDYEKLVRAFYLIAFGTAKERVEFFRAAVPVTTKDRLKALVELRDSGPGRPTQVHDIEMPPDVPLFAPGFDIAVIVPRPGGSEH